MDHVVNIDLLVSYESISYTSLWAIVLLYLYLFLNVVISLIIIFQMVKHYNYPGIFLKYNITLEYLGSGWKKMTSS